MTTVIETYDFTLTLADRSVQKNLQRLNQTNDQLEYLGKALDYLDDIKDDVTSLERTADALGKVLSLLGKFSILRPLTDPLKRIVQQIENRAEDIKDTVEKKPWKELEDLKDDVDKQKSAVEKHITALELVDDEIRSVKAAIGDAATGSALDHMPGYASAAFDNAEETLAGANTDRVRAVIEKFDAAVAKVEGALNKFTKPLNDMVGVAGVLGKLMDKLDVLARPSEMISDALEPVEWVLDFADKLIDKIVSPILDPLMDMLGFDDLVDRIMKELGLPDLGVFDDFIDMIGAARDALLEPYNVLQDRIDAFTGQLSSDGPMFNVLAFDGTPDGELVTGDDYRAEGPDNLLNGGDGDDVLAGGEGDDTLNGEGGNDVLIGGIGDDVIDGGTGRNVAVLLANFGDFGFVWDEAAQTLTTMHLTVRDGQENQGTDTITNVEHVVFLDDRLALEDFSRVQSVENPAGGTLIGDGDTHDVPTEDFLLGGAGGDLLQGLELDDFLFGRGGDDTLEGGRGDDLLRGGSGADTIDGGVGDDTVIFEDGDSDALDGVNYAALGAASAALLPVASDDAITNVENMRGGGGVDWFFGDDGDNRIEGGGGGDILSGMAGDDVISGGDGDDWITGGDGDDTILGGRGTDVFVGGFGSDYYDGGSFADDTQTPNGAYLWYGDDGEVDNADDLFGTPDGTPHNQQPKLLEMGFTTAGPEVFPDHIEILGHRGVVKKYDATGTLIGKDKVENVRTIIGTQGDDMIKVGPKMRDYWGGAGNDYFTSVDTKRELSNWFFIDGGAGDDTFKPGQGIANALGRAGNDLFIIDGENFQVINGGDDIDTIDFSGSNRAWLVDLPANNSYGFLEGTVDEANSAHAVAILTYNVEEIIGSVFGDIVYGDEGRPITFWAGKGDDTFHGWDAGFEDPDNGATVYGMSGNDVFHASIGDDRFEGGKGDDTFVATTHGGGGQFAANTWIGNSGDDVFRPGYGGSYFIDGGAGIDVLDLSDWDPNISNEPIVAEGDALPTTGNTDVVFKNIEIIIGSEFVDVLSGDDGANRFLGGDNQDVIDGGGGNDLLFGNRGNDVIRGGDGDDLVYGGVGLNTLIGGAGTDTASWDPRMDGDGWNPRERVDPVRTDGSLAADLMRGEAVFTHDAYGYEASELTRLSQFENVIGTSGDDDIAGDAANNVLSGGIEDGNDRLIGRGGNDRLSGGRGDDTLIGDGDFTGIDLAYVNAGLGTGDHLLAEATPMPAGGALTIEFVFQDQQDTDIANSFLFSYATPSQANALALEINGSGELRFILGHDGASYIFWETGVDAGEVFNGDLHRISFSFDDATGMGKFYVDGNLLAEITGFGESMAFEAGGTIVLGQDQDSLGGGFQTGQRTDGGYGDIRIYDDIRSDAEIADNYATLIDDPEAEDSLVANWQVDAQTGEISDATGNGAVMTAEGQVEFLSTGSEGNDILLGENGDDWLEGGGGNDVIDGGRGRDTVVFAGAVDTTVDLKETGRQNTGHGRDKISGAENLISDAGADTLKGDTNDNILSSGAGDDKLVGRGGNDTLLAGDGTDKLKGGGGDDTLNGGTGDDVLIGQRGADTFVFGDGFGADRINDFDTAEDRIDLRGLGASQDDFSVSTTPDGENTVITLVATGDSIELSGVAFNDESRVWDYIDLT